MNRGVTYDTIGKHEEALKDYGQCIAIRESLHEAGRLYDWQYYLGSAWLNKGILMATGLNDTDGALEIINHAIRVLEAEEKLSYNANDMLERLRYQRDKLTSKPESTNSTHDILQSMSDEELNGILDKLAEQACEEMVGELRKLDRDSLIEILSQIIRIG